MKLADCSDAAGCGEEVCNEEVESENTVIPAIDSEITTPTDFFLLHCSKCIYILSVEMSFNLAFAGENFSSTAQLQLW